MCERFRRSGRGDHVGRAGLGADHRTTWQHVVLIARTGEAGSGNDMREKMGGWRPCRTTRAIRTGVPGAQVLYEITAVGPRGA